MVIVNAKKEDLDEIMAIERAVFSAPWNESGMLFEIESEDALFSLAKDKGEILGFSILHMFEDEGEIFNVAVKEEYRNRKIGTALMKNTLHFAKRQRLSRIFLEVRESNMPARHLYENSGFKSMGIRKNYYDYPKENAVMMVCEMEGGEKR